MFTINTEIITDRIVSVVDEHVPIKTITVRTDKPWMTSEVKKKIKQKENI